MFHKRLTCGVLSLGADTSIILRDRVIRDTSLDPISRKIWVTLEPPSLSNNQADVDKVRLMLERELGSPVNISIYYMQRLPVECRAGNWQVTVTAGRKNHGWEVIDVEKGHVYTPPCGLAVDVGTTTVVVYLVDMTTGDILDVEADYNGQVALGEDILTRIYLAGEKCGRQKLQNAVIKTLNRLTGNLCRRNQLRPQKIAGAAVAGNTTMIHLLLGLSPENICMAPYTPVVNNPGFLPAGEIGLDINPAAPVYCLPSVGSYVGGDAVAGVLVSGMHKKEEIALLVDIGTNGEMIMGNQDWLVACAGAAGPALEGGVAEAGMRAEPGAVESVIISPDGSVSYRVIGGERARGICGSGLVDCLAQLFLAGIVDRAGKFKKGDRFTIVPGSESATGKDIVITQQDIDNLMRTKGAVSAALDLLMESVGCSLTDLSAFYAAGAFGQYLNLESAITIGLYPDLPRERMVRLGNSAGEGARLALISDAKRRELEEIVKRITYFELNANEVFMNKFVGSKFLPHTNLDYFPTVKAKMAERGLINA